MKNITMVLLLVVLVISGTTVFAEEAIKEEATKDVEPEDHVYHYPEIETEYFGLLGYRYVSRSGSTKAGEFEYLHSSAPFGADIRAFPFPHRFHLEADVLNKKDYFSDMGYAYKDMILFRFLDRSFYHNLDRINLLGSNIDVRDADKSYGVTVDIKNMFLRFKTPDFPWHIYIDSRFMDKYGNKQQIFNGGSGGISTSALTPPAGRRRTSESRYLDWNIKDITLGTNAHLGPVEIDISHGQQRFNADGDNMPSYRYRLNATTYSTLPHNLVPDTKSSTSTLKLHTSFTGRLVVSTTFSKTKRENQDSGAKADYLNGNLEVVYIPLQMLNFVARYRHKEAELENPTSLPAGYLGFSSYTTPLFGIRHSLSSQADTFTAIARFRPISKLGMTAEYTYEEIERQNSDEWLMNGKTKRRNFILSANARPFKQLSLKAKYAYLDIDNPAHNTQPNKSNSENISLNWTPLHWANMMLNYSTAKEEKNGLHYVTSVSVNAENRTAKRDRFLSSVTLMMNKKFSITPSYAYMHNKIVQDLVYAQTATIVVVDRDVPYKDTAHSYALNMNYLPQKNWTVNAEASYTKGRGGFNPSHPNVLSTESIASFSNLKIRERAYSAGTEYRLKGDWTLGLKGSYNSFKDMIDNAYDDATNGIIRIVLLTVSKKW